MFNEAFKALSETTVENIKIQEHFFILGNNLTQAVLEPTSKINQGEISEKICKIFLNLDGFAKLIKETKSMPMQFGMKKQRKTVVEIK